MKTRAPMTVNGKGPLFYWNAKEWSTITGNSYVEHILPVLRAFWKEQVEDISDAATITVMQDNATLHTAMVVKQWFAGTGAGIALMNWPADSPDLNPISNVW